MVERNQVIRLKMLFDYGKTQNFRTKLKPVAVTPKRWRRVSLVGLLRAFQAHPIKRGQCHDKPQNLRILHILEPHWLNTGKIGAARGGKRKIQPWKV